MCTKLTKKQTCVNQTLMTSRDSCHWTIDNDQQNCIVCTLTAEWSECHHWHLTFATCATLSELSNMLTCVKSDNKPSIINPDQNLTQFGKKDNLGCASKLESH